MKNKPMQFVKIRAMSHLGKQLLSGFAVCLTVKLCFAASIEPYVRKSNWHESLLASFEAIASRGVEDGFAPFESDTVRGGGPARQIRVPLAGAKELYLFVTGVPDVKWAVANWAEARLIRADGSVESLTKSTNFAVLLGRWEKDLTLKSGLYQKLRVNGRTFDRGLNVQADSAIRVPLDGSFARFEAIIGLDDWAGTNGSVRFSVLGARSGAVKALWAPLMRDFSTGPERLQMKWEREDRIFEFDWRLGDWTALAQRYAQASARVPALARQASQLAGQVRDRAGMEHLRETCYLRSRSLGDALDQARSFDFDAARSAIGDLVASYPGKYPPGHLTRLDELQRRLAAILNGFQADKLEAWTSLSSTMAELETFKREALLANPLLDFEQLLVLKRVPTGGARRASWEGYGYGEFLGIPRQSSWNYGTMPNVNKWTNEVAVLSPVRPQGRLATLFKPPGTRLVNDLELHWNADKLLFSMPDTNRNWQVWELTLESRPARNPSSAVRDSPQSSMADVPGSFENQPVAVSPLSPHPGPLPKERESSLAPSVIRDSTLGRATAFVLPLPKGEGRGEGKGDVQTTRLPPLETAKHTSLPAVNGLCQLTPSIHSDVHNYDAIYLPSDEIIFLSTAPLQGVPCNAGVIVGMMYKMGPNAERIHQLTFEQDHDYTPSVLNNGRVLYLRWDYTDTPHVWNRLLMSMNPDGTGQMEFTGANSYWPNAMFFARAIPDHPTKIVTIVTGHHEGRVGELFVLDPAQGRRETDGVVQRIPRKGPPVLPKIQDKLTEHSWPKFLHPWPLSERYFLVACKPEPDALWGIYLVDVFDNMTLVKEEEGFALLEPVPLRPRARPPVIPDKAQSGRKDALVFMQDVYSGTGLPGVPRGTVKALRLFTYYFGYQRLAGIDHRVGADGPWEAKRVLGTVPVEADGSALFRVPAKTPISFQPLDAEGKAVGLMRSWMSAMPGENVSCVGCHDQQSAAPPGQENRIALASPPREITPWRGPLRGFSFAREVQPVLDKYCVACHDGSRSAGLQSAVSPISHETGVVGTSRRDVPARVVAGGTGAGEITPQVLPVAPLHAARTAQRAVPTTEGSYPNSIRRDAEVQAVAGLQTRDSADHKSALRTAGLHAAPDLRRNQGGFVVYRGGQLDGQFVRREKDALLGKYGAVFDPSYVALRQFVRVGGLESDLHQLPPREFAADTSELIQMLAKGHYNVQLDADAWDRLVTWIDLNAPCHGTWAETTKIPGSQSERRLELRELYGGVIENCEAVPEVESEPEPPKAILPEPEPRLQQASLDVEGWPFGAEAAKSLQTAAGPVARTVDLGSGVTMELMRIPSGSFVMGDAHGAPDERDVAVVRIEKPFWMAKCEVSNEQFAKFNPSHDSRFEHRSSWWFDEEYIGWPLNRPKQPVVRVSWEEAMAFCQWLSAKLGEEVTLPTEAQWEWACRAGTSTPLNYGGLDTDFSPYGNMGDASLRKLADEGWRPKAPDLVAKDSRFDDGALVTTEIGRYTPNAWGLHDMHGNVAEWTRTAYRPAFSGVAGHRESDVNGERKVIRGGSWRDRPKLCRSASRWGYDAWQKVFNVGFRVIIEPGPKREISKR